MIPNNIYAPFPFPLHLGFCIFSTLFLIIQFYRKKHLYYILLILGIDLTFVTQFNEITDNDKLILAIGIAEFVLLLAIIILMAIASRKNKKYDDKPEIEFTKEHHELINEADDIIKRAFSDDEE